jgi:L-ribulose-5-phosphate 4-epimerase
MLEQLKADVYRANLDLVRYGLVTLTWGNASALDRRLGLMVIKPSGVPYGDMEPEQMVVTDLQGQVVEGDLRPSSDAPTHALLYRRWPQVGGITHTHSRFATMFAQARAEIPCLGTTHADHFRGAVPVARPLTAAEVAGGYEVATGETIAERFADLDPLSMPAVLTAGHGPFSFGRDAAEAVRNAVALEAVAEMALGTLTLRRDAPLLEPYVLEKHYQRKHGAAAYYGQKPPSAPSGVQ